MKKSNEMNEKNRITRYYNMNNQNYNMNQNNSLNK